jgi:hypothetical protein
MRSYVAPANLRTTTMVDRRAELNSAAGWRRA